MRVIIYAAVDVFYYSFYIEGFYNLLGRRNVKFRSSPFPNFPERTFAALVKSETGERKIIIDAFDSTRINKEMLEWSDVYGKVNYKKDQIPDEEISKVVPLGPSFGIKIWNLPQLLYHAVFNYRNARDRIAMQENFFKNYWRQYKRLPIKEYDTQSEIDENYIYFMSSLWEKEQTVNKSRAKFIKACKNIHGIIFEGGFAPRSDDKDLGYERFISPRMKLAEYLKKIKRSVLVFNTPAVEGCHGWKLGEYLAMGKAIISTEIFNELPVDLIPGKHLYILKKNEYIEDAILKIRGNSVLRNSLEKNARNYYERNLTPVAVINCLLEHNPGRNDK